MNRGKKITQDFQFVHGKRKVGKHNIEHVCMERSLPKSGTFFMKDFFLFGLKNLWKR